VSTVEVLAQFSEETVQSSDVSLKCSGYTLAPRHSSTVAAAWRRLKAHRYDDLETRSR